MNVAALCRCCAALSDAERVDILEALRDEVAPLPYPVLVARMRRKNATSIAQSTVSYRLRVLVDAGLVERHAVDGRETLGEGAHFAYSLVVGKLRALASALAARDAPLPRGKEQAS